MQRVAWTEPYTVRERLSIRWDLKRYDIAAFLREGIWRRVSYRLPDKLVLWCFIRVMSHAWSDAKHVAPDDITYSDAYKAWKERES